MTHRDIVVIGASAGGGTALQNLLAALPANLDAAVLIATHLAPNEPSRLPEILQAVSRIPVKAARDNEPLEIGTVYVAVPDHHLLIEQDRVRLSRGPREVRFRDRRVVPLGCGLPWPAHDRRRLDGRARRRNRGALGDQAEGRHRDRTVARRRGSFLRCRSTPSSTSPSTTCSGSIRCRPCSNRWWAPWQSTSHNPKKTIRYSSRRASRSKAALDTGVRGLGTTSFYTCPECHGSLVEIREGSIKRYRCHTGHAYTGRTLAEDALDTIEMSVWSSISHLEELSVLLAEMRQSLTGLGDHRAVARYAARARQVEDLLTRMQAVALHPAFDRAPPEKTASSASRSRIA